MINRPALILFST